MLDYSKAKKVKLESDTITTETISTKDVKTSKRKHLQDTQAHRSRSSSLSNNAPLNPTPPSTVTPYIPSSNVTTSTIDSRGGQLSTSVNHVGTGSTTFTEILPGMDDSLDVRCNTIVNPFGCVY